MFDTVKALKRRLAQVKTTSLRYRYAKEIWGEDRIKRSHACVFTWVMVPLSTFGYIFLGFILLLVAVVVAIGWFLGFSATFLKDGKDGFTDYETLFHKYKYRPRKGTYKRFAPWQYLTPIAFVGLLVFLGSKGWLWTAVTATGSWFFDTRVIIVAIVAVMLALYGLGILISRKGRSIGRFLGTLCPPTEVVVIQTEDSK